MLKLKANFPEEKGTPPTKTKQWRDAVTDFS